MFYIFHILVSSCCTFVHFQIIQRNNVYLQILNIQGYTTFVTLSKVNSRSSCYHFNSNGRDPHANDFIFFKK